MATFHGVGFAKQNIGSRTFFVRPELSDAQPEIAAHLQHSLDESFRVRYNGIVESETLPPLFVKARKLRHRKHRVKATLARFCLTNSSPAIAEIINHLDVAAASYIPKLAAYGYQKNRFGFIESVVIATEYCENTFTLREYLERNPDRRPFAILRALELLGRKIDDGIFHLDCWIDNILTDVDLNQVWLIDLEYCKVGSRAPRDEQLAFCLGYLYHYRLNEYIGRDDYFSIVRTWLEGRGIGSADDLLRKALVSAESPLSRRERMVMF